MKTYRQIKKSKDTTLVMGFGRMNPFTIGHALLIKKLVEEAKKRNADHKMYLSRSQDKKKNPLSIEKKMFWARKSAPGVNFVAADDNVRTFIEAVMAQNGKYDHLVMIAGSDRLANYKELLNKYNGKEFNFKTVEVVSAGERDPDADGASGMSATKLREAAANNNFALFKSGVSSTLNDNDARKMMKDIRAGMGIKPVSESSFKISAERDKFYRGDTFKVGQIVKENEKSFEILDRCSNYVVVCDDKGEMSRKFMNNLTVVEDIKLEYPTTELSFKGFVPSKYFMDNPEVVAAFKDTISRYNSGQISDAVAILKAMKNTDLMLEHLYKIVDLGEHPGEHAEVNGKVLEHYAKLRDSLTNIGEFEHHRGYLQPLLAKVNYAEAEPGGMEESVKESVEMPYVRSTDKLKVARIISDALGLEPSGTSPDLIVNAALRKIRNKPLKADSLSIISNMLELAKEVGIEYDERLLPNSLKEDADSADYKYDRAGKKRHKKIKVNHDSEDDYDEKEDDDKDELHELTNKFLNKYSAAANKDFEKAKQSGDSSKMYKRGKGLMQAAVKKISNTSKEMRKEGIEESAAENEPEDYNDGSSNLITYSDFANVLAKHAEEKPINKQGHSYKSSSETHRKQIVSKLMDR